MRHTDVTSTNAANLANVVFLGNAVGLLSRAVEPQALDRLDKG